LKLSCEKEGLGQPRECRKEKTDGKGKKKSKSKREKKRAFSKRTLKKRKKTGAKI